MTAYFRIFGSRKEGKRSYDPYILTKVVEGFPQKTIKPLAVDFSGVGVLERYWMLKSQRCGLRNKAKTAQQDRRMFEWIMS